MSQLNFVTSFIARHGSLFDVIGVHPRVIQLVCNLHASSWVTYGSLGSMVFNTPYALALMALNDELLNRGVVMRIHASPMKRVTVRVKRCTTSLT